MVGGGGGGEAREEIVKWLNVQAQSRRGGQVQMREERNCNFKLCSFDFTFNYKMTHSFRKN